MKLLLLVLMSLSLSAQAKDLYATSKGKDANLTIETGCLTGQFKSNDLGEALLEKSEYKAYKSLKTDELKADTLEANLGLRVALSINGVDQNSGMLSSIDVSVGDKKDRLKIKTCLTVGSDLKAALSRRETFGFDLMSVTLSRSGKVTYLPGQIGGDEFLVLTGSPKPFRVNLKFPLGLANARYQSRDGRGKPGTVVRVIKENLTPAEAFGGYAETTANLNDKAETASALWNVNPDQDMIYVIDVEHFGKVTIAVLATGTPEEAADLAKMAKELYPQENFLVYAYSQLAEKNNNTPNPVIDVWSEFVK